MTIYSVYLPPLGSSKPPAETFRLIPDKKSPWALIAPLFWLLYHRLWLALLAYLVVTAAIALLFSWQQHIAIAYLSALPGLYLLLEGQELVSAKFERMGWRFAGVVEGEDKEEAEIRYLASGVHTQPEQLRENEQSSAHFRHLPKKNVFQTQGLFPE